MAKRVITKQTDRQTESGQLSAHHPIARHQLTARHWRWAMPVAAAFLGLMVSTGALLAIQARWQADDAKRQAAPPYARSVGAYTEAVSDLYRMSVTSNVKTVTNDPAFTPEPSQNLVMFAISVTNTSKTVRPFLPSIQTYIRDDEGGTYPMHPSTSVTNPLPATDLAPGQTVSGQVSYAIPAGLKKFRFFVDPDWAGMTPVVFDLSR
ncbi:MAG TPA: DUF4352 domain-containing protein [Candidatus Saccharimonadia bacterium]